MKDSRTDSELAIYREGVIRLLQLRVNKEISNSFPEHAAVLFEQFFRHAKNQVRIFCRNLSASVFDCDFVVQAAKGAVSRGITLEILLQDQPEKSAFTEFLKTVPGVFVATVVSQTAKNASVNFAVMDNCAYRFEDDRDHIKATANMFNPSLASRFVSKFEELQLNSAPMSLAVANDG